MEARELTQRWDEERIVHLVERPGTSDDARLLETLWEEAGHPASLDGLETALLDVARRHGLHVSREPDVVDESTWTRDVYFVVSA